jgi:enoyl-CoA hydratase/carnithine racemase
MQGVIRVVLDDPTTRNALSVARLRELSETLAGLGEDPAVRAVVLTGAGTTFSSGADRGELGDPAKLAELARLTEQATYRLAALPQPVVARVNGPAFGAGLALVAACDLAFAADTAQFAFPEVRFGLVAGPAITACRPRLTDTAMLDLFLTGRPFDAAEAAACGLLTRVVPAAELDACVDAALSALISGDATALAATKRAIRGMVR